MDVPLYQIHVSIAKSDCLVALSNPLLYNDHEMQQLREECVMATAVRVSEELVTDARKFSRIDHRSVAGQIDHWARMGKCAEENPDLTYSLIKEILIGLEDLEQGEKTEYRFG